MLPKREIIVVAPDQYKDLARKLAHEMSKVQGISAAVWTPRVFEDNEHMHAGDRYAISIGNDFENSVAEGFISCVGWVHNKGGSCYQFDGAKAVIFGKVQKRTKEIIKKGSINYKDIIMATISTTALGNVSKILKKYQDNKSIEAEIGSLYEKTQLASNYFLSECFEKWIGISR